MTTLAVVLTIVAAAALMLELMIPSFGLFGLVAATTYTYALILAFRESREFGVGIVLLGVVAAPFALTLGFKLMRRTALGRTTMLAPPGALEIGRLGASRMAALIGREGVATTDLRPAGNATIEGTRHDVVAAFGFVAKGTPVRVVAVEGAKIMVEAVQAAATTETKR